MCSAFCLLYAAFLQNRHIFGLKLYLHTMQAPTMSMLVYGFAISMHEVPQHGAVNMRNDDQHVSLTIKGSNVGMPSRFVIVRNIPNFKWGPHRRQCHSNIPFAGI